MITTETLTDENSAPEGVLKRYTLSNDNGISVQVINYGGIITSLRVPDRNGNVEDVVLGFSDLKQYITKNAPFFGAIVGRFANRIAGGTFSIEGKTYQVPKNEEKNALHGGNEGFHTKFWDVEIVENTPEPTLKLSYQSRDGEEGFPGNLSVTVHYVLTKDNALEISYEAQTDKTTVVNLSQHSYFNLSGDFSKAIVDHELQLESDAFLPVDSNMIPLGELEPVEDSPFDFRKAKPIGKDIGSSHEQLEVSGGYDHNFILRGEALRRIATVFHPDSGRVMEASTTEPGVQFYSGNSLDGKYDTKGGGKNEFRTGFCLETQHFPDSPNQPHFPSALLKPGEKWKSKTVYKFLTRPLN